MTAETAWQPAPAGLKGKLVAIVRPQFRVDVYLPDPHDAVLGCPACLVPGCDRSAGEHRLCSPHGYCGLPVQKSCPHANACLTCPVFLTGPEFLPELREHRGRTLTLITAAQVAGHSRVAQMNQQVLTNLDRMIEGVETPNPATALQPQAEVSDAI